MVDTGDKESEDSREFSRRDFLRFCSLALGGLAMPPAYASTLERTFTAPRLAPFTPKIHFQWQNEILRKTIYPMREVKLRDFLIYYQEVDVWSQYKDRDINALTKEVHEYKKDWEAKAVAAQGEYTRLRDYFLKADVRVDY